MQKYKKQLCKGSLILLDNVTTGFDPVKLINSVMLVVFGIVLGIIGCFFVS